MAKLPKTCLDDMDSKFVRMWPRSVLEKLFVIKKKRLSYPKRLKAQLELLDRPGVYVLYDEHEHVHYIGTTKKLGVGIGERILTHVKPNAKYGRRWTHFSAFLIGQSDLRREIERILISAVPTSGNSTKPMRAHKLPTLGYKTQTAS